MKSWNFFNCKPVPDSGARQPNWSLRILKFKRYKIRFIGWKVPSFARDGCWWDDGCGCYYVGGETSNIFVMSIPSWGRWTHFWWAYFSDGLVQPPTSHNSWVMGMKWSCGEGFCFIPDLGEIFQRLCRIITLSKSWGTVDGSEILHQLIGSLSCLSHYLQDFIHPRWCRISSINSSWGITFGTSVVRSTVQRKLNCHPACQKRWPDRSSLDLQFSGKFGGMLLSAMNSTEKY